jgi:ubiquinone/menaquinone biosynthesis C-methylase UbiE
MDKIFYTKDLYVAKNPTLHAEDSYWKFTKIVPLVDEILANLNFMKQRSINILDIGGGAGIILNKVSEYIESQSNLKVAKFMLDLTPAMLATQRNNNPDAKGVINADITQAPVASKTFDIVLCLDVLEHIPDYKKALKEIKKISHYAIFKIPLEDNLYLNILNLLTNDSQRRDSIESVGHLHFFNYFRLKKEITTNCGAIINLLYTDNIGYLLSKKTTRESMGRIERQIKKIGLLVFPISPKLSSIIFNDFVVVSVNCS